MKEWIFYSTDFDDSPPAHKQLSALTNEYTCLTTLVYNFKIQTRNTTIWNLLHQYFPVNISLPLWLFKLKSYAIHLQKSIAAFGSRSMLVTSVCEVPIYVLPWNIIRAKKRMISLFWSNPRLLSSPSIKGIRYVKLGIRVWVACHLQLYWIFNLECYFYSHCLINML